MRRRPTLPVPMVLAAGLLTHSVRGQELPVPSTGGPGNRPISLLVIGGVWTLRRRR